MRTLLLKLVPYLLSLVIGSIFYVIADIYVQDLGIKTLIVNIAGGLLSIPFIFIFYELVNDFCSRDIKSTLFNHVSFEINGILFEVIPEFRRLLGITQPFNKDDLSLLFATNESTIQKSLHIDASQVSEIQKAKDRLQDLLYKNADSAIFTDKEMQTLFAITKNLGIIAKEISLNKNMSNKKTLAKTIAALFQNVSSWLDSCEEDEIVNHHGFTLIK